MPKIAIASSSLKSNGAWGDWPNKSQARQGIPESASTVIYNGTEYTQQGDIEHITMQVNEAKVQASADTCFLQEPL